MSHVRLLLLAAATLLPACGNDDAATDLPDAGYNCALDDRDEEFLAGMEKVGAKGMTFRLMASSPAPPVRGDNVWEVEVEDDAGAALAGATIKVISYMPDHRHTSPAVPTITETPDGHYELDPVNMFMPGVWEVTLQATPDGAGQSERDEVVFTFCVGSAN